MKKRSLLLVVIVIFILGCQPSEEAIQKALSETQAAMATNTPVADLPTYLEKYKLAAQAYGDFYINYVILSAKIVNAVAKHSYDPSIKLEWDVASENLISAAKNLDSIEPVPQEAQQLDDYLSSLLEADQANVTSTDYFVSHPSDANLNKITEQIKKRGALMELIMSEQKKLGWDSKW
jgi:hypothetical protein